MFGWWNVTGLDDSVKSALHVKGQPKQQQQKEQRPTKTNRT